MTRVEFLFKIDELPKRQDLLVKCKELEDLLSDERGSNIKGADNYQRSHAKQRRTWFQIPGVKSVTASDSRRCIEIKTMEYTVSKTNSQEDYKQVEDMFHDFFKDMPVVAMFGLENSPPDTQPRIYGPEDFIVKATDSAGTIIGFAINKTDTQTKPKPAPDRIELREFLNFVKDSAKMDLPERTIELRVLSVSKEWRQRGIAKRLVEESMKEAKAAGFEAMKICCVSEYTAVLVEKMGWRELYRLAYKDYPGLSGKNIQLKIVPGQDYVYYYVVDL